MSALPAYFSEHHFFVPNAIDRFSLGTKNKRLKYNPDESLKLIDVLKCPFMALSGLFLAPP